MPGPQPGAQPGAQPRRTPGRFPLPGARFFAAPVARLTAAIAATLLVVALIAGAIRALPLLLAPGVPLRLAPVLARGVAGVALETALFVAPPIAWALAASRLVDRGEARALFALGVHPARIIAASWPAAAAVALTAALASAAWGREATAPGRALRALLAEARSACAAALLPAVADVPLLGVSWVCLPGEPPRALVPVGQGVLSATAIAISDDLHTLDATDLHLLLERPASDPRPPRDTGAPPSLHIRATAASLRGVLPLGPSSNLPPVARALLIAVSAVALAVVAGTLVLAASLRARPAALALGAAGPAAALLVFSALERTPTPPAAYAAVPAAGLAALLVAGAIARRALRGG